MLYKFKLSHNAVEATQNICYVKSEGTDDHSTVKKMVKKILFGLQEHWQSGKAS